MDRRGSWRIIENALVGWGRFAFVVDEFERNKLDELRTSTQEELKE